MPEVIYEAGEIDTVSTYNLADFTVTVREDKRLADRSVRISVDGCIPEGMLVVDTRNRQVRLKGSEENQSLREPSTEVVSQYAGKLTYDNGLTVTKKFTPPEGTIEVTYEPLNREYGNIIIEVFDMRTLVTVDGDSVDLWPRT